MAKGAISKEVVIQKILETFEGSFLYNGGKELRIPMVEDGNEIQIKVALTCAKENVSVGGDTALPGVVETETVTATSAANFIPTEEELQNVSDLMEKLGFNEKRWNDVV